MNRIINILITFIFLFFCLENLFSKHNNIDSYSINFGSHLFNVKELNNAFSNSSLPKINNASILYGFNYYYNFDENDTNLNKKLYNEYKDISYSSIGIFSNQIINDDMSSPIFKYYLLELNRNFTYSINNSINLNLTYGILYTWSYITITESNFNYKNLKDYISNPDKIYEFSLNGLSLEFSVGLDFYLFSYILEYPEKISKSYLILGLNTSLITPMFYNNGKFKLFNENIYRNESNNEIPGLVSNFPFGLKIQLILRYEKICEYK